MSLTQQIQHGIQHEEQTGVMSLIFWRRQALENIQYQFLLYSAGLRRQQQKQ